MRKLLEKLVYRVVYLNVAGVFSVKVIENLS